MTDNLALYNRYAQPPQDALKAFNNGKFSGTDINPMWRIKALTEEFGPCGLGWYPEVKRMWREDTPDGAATVYCEVLLYVKYDGEWSKPITGIGGNTLTRVTRNGSSTTDEAYKMAYTDALGIACKALGFGADIWWKSNDTKYTAYQEPVNRREHFNRLKDAYRVTDSEIQNVAAKAASAGKLEGVNGSLATMSDDDFLRTIGVVEQMLKEAA